MAAVSDIKTDGGGGQLDPGMMDEGGGRGVGGGAEEDGVLSWVFPTPGGACVFTEAM